MIRGLFIYSFICCFALLLGIAAASAAAKMAPLAMPIQDEYIKIFTPPSVPPPTKNVYETIGVQKNLGKFTDMIDEAGLKDMLSVSGGEPVTVFVPTDEAMKEIPKDVMKRIEASKASLQSFVKYHVIAGSMVFSSAIKGRRTSPASANGEVLAFDGTDRKSPPKIANGALEHMDIAATNGVVHTVNVALVPPSLLQEPTAAQPPVQAPVVPAAPPAPSPAPLANTATGATTTGVSAMGSTTTASAAMSATTSTAAGATTTSSTAAADVTTSGQAAKITTTGVAKAPTALDSTSSAKNLPKGGDKIPTTGVAQPPKPAPEEKSGGFELFGHKFSW